MNYTRIYEASQEIIYARNLIAYLQNVPTIKEDHDDADPHIRTIDESFSDFGTTMEDKFGWDDDRIELEFNRLKKEYNKEPSLDLIKQINKDIYGW
jgi:hypothetical protein